MRLQDVRQALKWQEVVALAHDTSEEVLAVGPPAFLGETLEGLMPGFGIGQVITHEKVLS